MTVRVAQHESLRPQVSSEHMRELREPALVRTLLSIASDYVVIALSVAAVVKVWWLFPLAIVMIAGRQHSLLIFMHEAAHRSLSRKLWLNDLLGNLLCAWPMFLDVTAFRYVHLQHHRHEGSEGDPDFEFRSGEDWQFPRPFSKIVGSLARDFTGLSIGGAIGQVKYYGQAPAETRTWLRVTKLCYYACAAALLIGSGAHWAALLFWLLPILTVLKGLIRIREIAEHYGLPARNELDRTRTTSTNWLGRMLISPANIHFHLEHHLFPGVPWHSLPKLRELLMKDERYARESAHSPSFLAALRECSSDAQPVSVRPPTNGDRVLLGG